MNISDIIRVDTQNNHAEASAADGYTKAIKYLEAGFTMYKAGDTIILYKVTDDIVRYHSINAAPMRDFINSGHRFLHEIREHTAAYTVLTEPKLRAIVGKYFKKSTIVRGSRAITNLRKV